MKLSIKIKTLIFNSPFAKQAKYFQYLNHAFKISRQKGEVIKENKTIYCISPYKTGTTFLSSGFNENVAPHEPLHYFSLKGLNQDFHSTFIKRLNYLNLKLEVSGFLSLYVDKLIGNHLIEELQFISILRKPSSWVTSAINYWSDLGTNYDYINEFYWKERVGVDLVNFKNKNKEEQNRLLNLMGDFYLNYTEASFKIKNIDHVHIADLEKYMRQDLSLRLNENVLDENFFKRANSKKGEKYILNQHDKMYQQLIESKPSVWRPKKEM